jgi:hypothetical protein
MGIYSNGNIYGLRIYNYTNDDISNTLFEVKYDEIMSYQQKREAYLFYENLNDKKDIHIQFYTEAISSLDPDNREYFMMWQPLDLKTFLEKFAV